MEVPSGSIACTKCSALFGDPVKATAVALSNRKHRVYQIEEITDREVQRRTQEAVDDHLHRQHKEDF